MADDRKIVWGSYASVEESAFDEEGREKWTMYDAVKSSVGGRGSVVDLSDNQWNDSWCSRSHHLKNWENYIDSDDNSGNRWEDTLVGWSDEIVVGTSAYQLSYGVGSATDVDVAFLYIRNLGAVELTVSLNGSSGEYDLYLPEGASIALRGGDASFHCDDVHAKTASGSTNIEYVLAKK